MPKPKVPPVCMKSYAFQMYKEKLRPVRTYTPHAEEANKILGGAKVLAKPMGKQQGGVKGKQGVATNQSGSKSTPRNLVTKTSSNKLNYNKVRADVSFVLLALLGDSE